MEPETVQHEAGLTIAAMRSGGNERKRLALLKEHRTAVRTQLAEVQCHLAIVERKIATYEEIIDG